MYIDENGKRWLTAQDHHNAHPTPEHPADPLYPAYFSCPQTAFEAIKTYHQIQGSFGNWNYDDYMLGLFNGIEMCLAALEERDPEFRTREDQLFAFDENGNIPALEPEVEGQTSLFDAEEFIEQMPANQEE